jgi:branched-chain amino acid aminotransferase
MHGSIDGSIAPVEELTISVTDEGLVRGDGVFEVVRLYGGVPFALDDHYARMERSAQRSRLEADFAALRAEVDALLEATGPADAALRIMCTRGGRRIALIEQVTEFPATIALATVTYSPTRVLDGIKTLSYGANMLCTRLAREAGAYEALLVTPHGRVLEAPTSSFFYVRDGRLLTPPLSEHILESITRRWILELFDVEERETALDDLGGIEEAFLASTFKEALPVHAIGDITLDAPGPVTREVGERLGERIAAEVGAASAR